MRTMGRNLHDVGLHIFLEEHPIAGEPGEQHTVGRPLDIAFHPGAVGG